MAINDKIQLITNFFNQLLTPKKENYYSPPKKKVLLRQLKMLL